LSPLLLLGEASYAVYLLQFPVFYYFEKLWAGLGMGEFDPSAHSNRLFYLFYLIALIGSSVLAFKFLEQPARSFLQGRLPWSWKPIQATASRFVPRP
jgi:peptidoglycan/LPS O-acetylase OafA/YrhL